MQIRFKQDINHNYMILDKDESLRPSLAEKMLLHNNIAGLLKMSIQHLNGKAYYYYDIRSRQSLSVLFEGRSMSGMELRRLLSGLVKIAEKMGDYLLKSSDILVKPQCIFWDLETDEPVFCCYPENGEDYEEAYMELAQFLIDAVDKEDEEAVKLAYDYFNRICDGIYSPESLLNKIIQIDDIETADETVYEDPLPPGSLWEDEEGFDNIEETIQQKEGEEKREHPNKIKGYTLFCLAGIVLVIAAAVAAIVYPPFLGLLGMKEVNAVSIGSTAAVLVAILVVALVYFDRKGRDPKNSKMEDTGFFAANKDMLKCGDKMEQAEFVALSERIEAKECNGQTVLLSEYTIPSASSAAGRTIKTEIAKLTGDINGKGVSFEIDRNPFTIGKMAGKADAVIADRRVSRLHATIRQDGGRYFLSDLNSTNGTCLNDRRLEQDESAALEDGDIIKFANVMMRFSRSIPQRIT